MKMKSKCIDKDGHHDPIFRLSGFYDKEVGWLGPRNSLSFGEKIS